MLSEWSKRTSFPGSSFKSFNCLIKSLNLIGAGSLTWVEKSRIDTKHQTFVHLFHGIFDHLAGVVDHV